MDRLRQMNSFLRVSRSGSFKSVAEQLGQSPAAIARHVNDLEESLGFRLLNRSTRSISLTAAGKTYAELCERVAEDILQTEALLADSQESSAGSIKIIMPKSFGSMQLGDAIIEFMDIHHNISISVVLEDFFSKPQEFVEHGYDLAVRWGNASRDSTLVSSQLAKIARRLCASPQYIKEYGEPKSIEELERHNCLINFSPLNDQIWRFNHAGRDIAVKVSGDFSSDSSIMLRKSVLTGRGVAVLPIYCIINDLAEGRLVELLPGHKCSDNILYIFYREKRLMPLRLRLFIDFLRKWFADKEPIFRISS